MSIMCNLPNYQNRDLEELHQGKKQAKTTDAETIEMIIPDKILLSYK
jgi:hypothetical protein